MGKARNTGLQYNSQPAVRTTVQCWLNNQLTPRNMMPLLKNREGSCRVSQRTTILQSSNHFAFSHQHSTPFNPSITQQASLSSLLLAVRRIHKQSIRFEQEAKYACETGPVLNQHHPVYRTSKQQRRQSKKSNRRRYNRVTQGGCIKRCSHEHVFGCWWL